MMRRVMCVAVLALILGASSTVAETKVTGEVDTWADVPVPYNEQVRELVEAAKKGDVDRIIQAAKDLVNEIGDIDAGSVCVRGEPSKPLLDGRIPVPNLVTAGTIEIPAGPSAKSGGDADDEGLVWMRMLHVEVSLYSCSAAGIAHVAFTDSNISASGPDSWIAWLAQ